MKTANDNDNDLIILALDIFDGQLSLEALDAMSQPRLHELIHARQRLIKERNKQREDEARKLNSGKQSGFVDTTSGRYPIKHSPSKK